MEKLTNASVAGASDRIQAHIDAMFGFENSVNALSKSYQEIDITFQSVSDLVNKCIRSPDFFGIMIAII